MVMDNIELRGAVKYIDTDSGSDTSLLIGGDYFFSPAFAIGVTNTVVPD